MRNLFRGHARRFGSIFDQQAQLSDWEAEPAPEGAMPPAVCQIVQKFCFLPNQNRV